MINNNEWFKEFPGAVTVCDSRGIIIEMNDKAAKSFHEDGGYDLIGKSLIDCHPEPSRTKLKYLLETQTKNVYTIEKNKVKKIIYQVPWYKDGKYSGLVEMSLEIPFEIPHFVRHG
jgi:transcriptional regulator with PAS, ATPase and Fis domain